MIRTATANDAAGILKIYGPLCHASATTFETIPPPEEEMQARIEHYNKTHLWLVDADSHGVHAYAYAGQHRDRAAYRWSVDVSIYVSEDKRKTGIGTRLYTRLFVELRERGFYNAFAGITLPNHASVGLHEKLGFRKVGTYKNVGFKLGKWHDVGWWHLALKPLPPDHEPAEPLIGGYSLIDSR